MGVHVLYDEKNHQACMYCSTSEWAFGPVVYSENGRERMHQFLEYIKEKRGQDPREMQETQLEALYCDFRADYPEEEEK